MVVGSGAADAVALFASVGGDEAGIDHVGEHDRLALLRGLGVAVRRCSGSAP